MENITIIIPIHQSQDSDIALFNAAIKSLSEYHHMPIIIVGGEDTISAYKPLMGDFANVTYVNNEYQLNIQTQINKAVSNCKTKYFSILEMDDAYVNKWFDIFKEYEGLDNVSLYLPMVLNVDGNGGTYGFTNESVWATSFSNELGYLELSSLLIYPNFITSGGIFITDDFKAVGGLNPNTQITFWYEFLMRFLHNNKGVYTIPKVGYHHTVLREESFTELAQVHCSTDEISKWYDTAKETYTEVLVFE